MEKENHKDLENIKKEEQLNFHEQTEEFKAFCELMDEIEEDILPTEWEILHGE